MSLGAERSSRGLRDEENVGHALCRTRQPEPVVACERYRALAGDQGTAKGVVAYVGLDPQPHESGTSVLRHTRISRQGDRLLRARLYMGALGTLRGDNPLRAFYQRLVDRGKPKKLALLTAARKLLLWARAVFTSGQPFHATKTVKLAP